jgi:hypothetical protein
MTFSKRVITLFLYSTNIPSYTSVTPCYTFSMQNDLRHTRLDAAWKRFIERVTSIRERALSLLRDAEEHDRTQRREELFARIKKSS